MLKEKRENMELKRHRQGKVVVKGKAWPASWRIGWRV